MSSGLAERTDSQSCVLDQARQNTQNTTTNEQAVDAQRHNRAVLPDAYVPHAEKQTKEPMVWQDAQTHYHALCRPQCTYVDSRKTSQPTSKWPGRTHRLTTMCSAPRKTNKSEHNEQEAWQNAQTHNHECVLATNMETCTRTYGHTYVRMHTNPRRTNRLTSKLSGTRYRLNSAAYTCGHKHDRAYVHTYVWTYL